MRLASPIPARPIVDLVEQHVEDAALHWLRRQRAIQAPNYFFRNHIGEPGGDLGHLDRRLQAHLDGARIAGDLAWQIARDLLATGDPPELFVASILALHPFDSTRVDTVLAAALAEPAAAGLTSALAWLPFADIEPLARRLAEADAPQLRAIGLAAFALHRREPPALLAALRDPAPEPRRRALKAVGELARSDLLPILREHLTDPDPVARHQATVSAALLGDPRGAEHLFTLALDTPDSHLADRAIRLAARRLPLSSVTPWACEHIGPHSPHARLAIAAIADAGDPALIPNLLPLLTDPALARLAAAAITQITGVDLPDRGLEAPPPEDVSTITSDDPDDDDVDLDPDEDLPWPDPSAIWKWWSSADPATWLSGEPLLLGTPRTLAALTRVLSTASQAHRLAAAHLLFSLRPKSPLFEHRAPAHRQVLALLAQFAE